MWQSMVEANWTISGATSKVLASFTTNASFFAKMRRMYTSIKSIANPVLT